MSPLELEFRQAGDIRILASGTGEVFKEKPIKKIDKDGNESPIEPGEFVVFKKGETAEIPDIPYDVSIESRDSSLKIHKDHPPYLIFFGHDTVVITVEEKGCGFSTDGKRPSVKAEHERRAIRLEEKPVVVWTHNQELVEVSWRPEIKNPRVFFSPRSSPRRRGEVRR